MAGMLDLGKQTITKQRDDSYKRWFDISVLVIMHLALLPLWVMLWTLIPIVIWLGDRGPVFYRQQRAGKQGRVITVLKFRTMIPNADRIGPAWTMERDPRVTRFGRILRRTALDELPEIISILKGDMSLVGPRALDVGEHTMLQEEIPGFEERLRVLPGLSGPAQIYDRTDDANDKFRYDLGYLEEMSPWLDVRLLILSVWNTLGARWDRREGKILMVTADPAQSNEDAQNQEPISKDS
jgi:lipopolysaccharide/colanic/teichoic acid biosynthesis glycosyltransferase